MKINYEGYKIFRIFVTMVTINGQSAAKPLNSLIEHGERSTTIETTLLEGKEVEYTNICGKGRNLNTTFIYALVDPITGEIRYIGKSNNPKKRLSQHLCDRVKSHKTSWLKSLDRPPILEIIEKVYIKEWEFWEEYWITQFRSWGFNLTNLTSGGIGHKGFKQSSKTIAKRSKKLTGQKRSVDSRKRMSESRKGMVFSEEHKKNLSKAHIGLKYDPTNYGKHCFRKILQFDGEGTFIKQWDSIKEAAEFYKVHSSSISHCCAGRKKTIRGFIWKYLN